MNPKTPTTCEPTEEQRLVAYGIASGNQLSHDDLENLIAQALAQESSRARTDALLAAKAVAAEGRCDCHFAPCPHDEQGKVIAFHIQQLIDNPPRDE